MARSITTDTGRLTRRALLGAAGAAAALPACGRPRIPPASPGFVDAVEIAARIRRREITAAEAVEAAIRRAEALQGRLNFLVNADFDRALDRARQAPSDGAFAGAPFLIKDLEDYAGLPTRLGSRSRLAAPLARRQSAYVDAFDRAGFVVLGKSSVPEFGLSPTTEPVAFGPTRNPWDPSRSAGGSSGGAAAAVAAGVVPVAHASDGGGSIRIPASVCGLFGLKPSRGRMIGAGDDVRVTDFGAEHCLSVSVRDSAALFAATEMQGPGARYTPVGLVKGPGKRRLRIGYVLQTGMGEAPAPEVAEALEDVARLVDALGHHVEPTQWPMDGPQLRHDYLLLWAVGARHAVEAVARALGRQPDASVLEPFTLALAEVAAKAPPEALPAAIQRLEANALAYDTWLAARQFDVILSPATSDPAAPLGEFAPTQPLEALIPRLTRFVGYTPLHNVAGAPAMSVPLSWTRAGLPIGAMFAARAGAERTLFELAFELEAARPWASRLMELQGRLGG